MEWNFDLTTAPRGETRRVEKNMGGGKTAIVDQFFPEPIFAAGSGGVVTISKWLPKEGRWNMFTKDVPPIAWMPWPKHPLANG